MINMFPPRFASLSLPTPSETRLGGAWFLGVLSLDQVSDLVSVRGVGAPEVLDSSLLYIMLRFRNR